jgi:uncharacterized protein (TIGR03083 family)
MLLEQLSADGGQLADAAEYAGLDASVPSCPEWVVRDLVLHLGGVHRWAAAHVSNGATELIAEDLETVSGGWPSDATIFDWFREGHADLVRTLTDADPSLECATFLPAPSPLLFWTRRQAHETAMHRVDAQLSAGRPVTGFDSEFAADGVDELLTGFVVRRSGKLRTETASTLVIAPTDTVDPDTAWTLHVSSEPVVTTRGVEPGADATVTGAAHDIYLALWNRGPTGALEVGGDRELLASFAESVHVRWS